MVFTANIPIKKVVKFVKCTLGRYFIIKEWNCLVSPFKTLFLHYFFLTLSDAIFFP